MSLNKGLVGHWRVDSVDNGMVRDSSARENHGDMVNNPNLIVGMVGDQALEFDGEEDFIDTSLKENIQEDDFSISFWMNPDSRPNSGQRLVNKDPSTNGWSVSYGDPGEGRLRFFVRGMDTVSLDTSDIIQTDNWYHVVAVYDSSGNNRYIYVDGRLEASIDSDTGSPETNSDPISIAAEVDNERNFDGGLDDVRIYNRVLSDKEVKHLYNMRSQPKQRLRSLPVENGLVTHLDATRITGLSDGDSISRWGDRTPSDNHFTQNDSGNQPIYNENALYGKPAVDFNGGTSLETEIEALNNDDSNYTVIMVGIDGAGDQYGGVSRYTGWNPGNHLVGWQTTAIDTDGSRSTNSNSSGDNFVRTDINYVNSTECELFNNGEYYHTLQYDDWTARSTWRIGRRSSEAHEYDGKIGEVLIYERALSNNERENVESYLMKKWGIE